MNDILCRQIAIDYCCTPEEVLDPFLHFMEHRSLEGRRRFQEGTECFLKLAVINGKILFCGRIDIMKWCRDSFANADAEWFLEAKNLRSLNDRIHRDGYQIEAAHPFYIAEHLSEPVKSEYEIRWYRGDEIEQFRNDKRYREAYAFSEDAPDIIGVAAVQNGRIVGMAGASCDSPTMWQIGINVDPKAKNAGIGTMLVSLLKNELLKNGILPYYGTSMSHIASQKVALRSGFLPAWAELVTSKLD